MNEGTRGQWKCKRLSMGSELLCADIVTLTSAQILALFATPVTVIAAPLAGVLIVVDSILFAMIATATQYLLGGVITFQYNGGAVVHASSIPAAVVLAAAPTTYTYLAPNTQANGVTVPTATAVTVSNATQAFTTGTGTAKIWIRYRLITQ
jgi:hypothetical protein